MCLPLFVFSRGSLYKDINNNSCVSFISVRNKGSRQDHQSYPRSHREQSAPSQRLPRGWCPLLQRLVFLWTVLLLLLCLSTCLKTATEIKLLILANLHWCILLMFVYMHCLNRKCSINQKRSFDILLLKDIHKKITFFSSFQTWNLVWWMWASSARSLVLGSVLRKVEYPKDRVNF